MLSDKLKKVYDINLRNQAAAYADKLINLPHINLRIQSVVRWGSIYKQLRFFFLRIQTLLRTYTFFFHYEQWGARTFFPKTKPIRQSSCVNARGIPTTAYQVLLRWGIPPIGVPPGQVWRGVTWSGVPSPIGVPPGQVWWGYLKWGTPHQVWWGVPEVGYPWLGYPPARSDGRDTPWQGVPPGWTWLGYPPAWTWPGYRPLGCGLTDGQIMLRCGRRLHWYYMYQNMDTFLPLAMKCMHKNDVLYMIRKRRHCRN